MRQGCDISPRFVLNLILLNSFTSRSNDIFIVDIVANRFYGLPNHSRRGRVTVIMVCLTVFFSPSLFISFRLPVQVFVRSYRRGCLVVFHSDHHLLIYCQPGRLSDSGKDGLAHRKCRGLGQADRNCLWDTGLWIHQGILQGKHRKFAIPTFSFKSRTNDEKTTGDKFLLIKITLH